MTDWKTLWLDDRRCILACMCANLESDLSVGYNPVGDSVRMQIEEIAAYRTQTEQVVREWRFKSDDYVQKWCYRDLKKKGVIE